MKDKQIRLRFPRIRLAVPALRFRVPLPGGIYLGGGKIVLGSLSLVAVGFIASMFIVISKGQSELTWPSPGIYEAPGRVGAPVVAPERSQTLQLNLPAGSRIRNLTFRDVSIGKGGLTASFQIAGTSTAYLIVDDIIIRNSEFPTSDIANSHFYRINATSSIEVAGHTVTPTYSTSTADITIGSSRGVGGYVVDGGSVDRIIIATSGTGDVIVDTLTIDGVRASEGALDIDYVKAGTLTLANLRVGQGNINSADFVIQASVLYTTIADSINDVNVYVR